MSKTLILYVFHEYNVRVQHFLTQCIFKDEFIDFIIISNNTQHPITILPSYVKILYRENKGYDFGGWSDALLTDDLYKQYDSFIFVNSSVIGPFLPDEIRHRWPEVYLNGLINNVELFGSTINTCMDPINKAHVQSYIFSMRRPTLEFLIEQKLFSMTNYAITFEDAIQKKEILMSRLVLSKGWNIGALLPYCKNVDFTFKTTPPATLLYNDDIMHQAYNNVLWNAHDLVFIKGNRGVILPRKYY